MRPTPFLLALAAGTLLSGAANAEIVAALVDDTSLVHVDTTAKKAVKTVKVTGVTGRVLGIDVRPADGMIYALLADGTLATVDPATGAATTKSKLDTPLPAEVTIVDFNPVADRLRVIGADGTNLRINVDDGKVTKDGTLKFAEADAMKGKTPKVVAGAYTNSFKGTKETTLFDLEASGALLRQAPPNDGVLNTVGQLGMAAEAVAFDIVSDGQGANQGWAISGGTLYRVDLATGKAEMTGKIEGLSGTVRDIAILPKR